MIKNIVIDTDGGFDDAVALVLALRDPNMKVYAITTVSGKAPLDDATRNTLISVECAKTYQPPVYMGYEKPMFANLGKAEMGDGEDGSSDLGTLKEADIEAQSMHAVDALIDIFSNCEEEIELLTLGPLTNVAMAIRKNPDAMRKCKHITIMGGGYSYNNPNTVTAEYNVRMDAEAAAIVCGFGISFTMVTMEACSGEAILDGKALERVNACGNIGKFCMGTSKVKMDLYRKDSGEEVLRLVEPLAVAVLSQPEIVKNELSAYTVVETSGEFTKGATFFCEPGRLYPLADQPIPEANSRIVTAIDGKKFSDYIVACVTE